MRDKIYNFLNKNLKEFNPTALVVCSVVFLSLVGLITYKVSSSYALFTDTVNGKKTITLHYAEDKTTLYTDGTLIINERASDRAKNIQKHGAVTNEYAAMKTEGTDAEKYVFSSGNETPWKRVGTSITNVEIGQKIEPTSTAYWFYNLTGMTTGDFTNLDTKNVTNMNGMFYNSGSNSNVTSFTLIGLDNWDTSKVTSMNSMFKEIGYYATNWSIGNLNNWDTSKVTNMGDMFYDAAFKSKTFEISLSNWDTQSVTTMDRMFYNAGYSATIFGLDLSNWDTQSVTTMNQMFYNAGYSTTTWSIGDLSNWDTSSVISMASMFENTGAKATTWNSIGTLKVYATDIHSIFSRCTKAKATINIYSSFTDATKYSLSFYYAATASDALITVNYSSATTNINNIIATKSSNSNVVKGVQLD